MLSPRLHLPCSCAALLTLAGIGPVNASDFEFEIAGPFAVASAPALTFAGDFNDDGHHDLAVAHYASTRLSVLYGDGGGSFLAFRSVEVSIFPRSVAAADFDENGATDLLVGSPGNQVALLLGDGAGGFDLDTIFDTVGGGAFAAVSDFNEDGHVDFAVTEREIGPLGAAVVVFLGDGTGNFASPARFSVGDGPSELYTIDLDADGHVDLVVGHSSLFTVRDGSVGILRGDGSGGFAPESTVVLGYGGFLDTADFNTDGALDLAIVNVPSGCCRFIAIYLNNGAGGFDLTQTIAGLGLGGPYVSLATDFDQDGFTDLLLTDGGDFIGAANDVVIFHGDGTGNLAEPSVFTGFLYSPTPAVVADFDEDGRLDFGIAHFFDSAFVHLNRTSPAVFRRGDADASGDFNGLTDGRFLLHFQFVPGSPPPPCRDAADVDDDGLVSGLVDALAALNFQFVPGTPPPPAPGPNQCGGDPTPDGLGCSLYPVCP